MNEKTINDCDVVVLHCIYEHLDIDDVLTMKRLSKRFYKTVVQYLSTRFWRADYLDTQRNIIHKKMVKMEIEYTRIIKINTTILRYVQVHRGFRPDGYIAYVYLNYSNMKKNMKNVPEFSLLNDEIKFELRSVYGVIKEKHPLQTDKNTWIILVQRQSEKNLRRINKVLNKHKWNEIYIPTCLKNRKGYQEIIAAYAPPGVQEWCLKKMCKVCGRDHMLFVCPNVVCGVCKIKGHLTRSCPHVKCTLCKNTGHLTTRCPKKMVCFKCGKPGHISKRCYLNINQ